MKKAQTSVEFLMIFGVALAILLIVVLLSQQKIGDVTQTKSASDARNTVDDLASAAKDVYSQGVGAKKQVFVRIPSGYQPTETIIGNKIISIEVDGTDYAAGLDFKVRGYLPNTAGGHWVWVVSEGNRVRIGDAMMELSKNWIYLVMDSNSTETTSLSVKNIWIMDIDISTDTTWTATDVDMSGVPSEFQLDINASELITLQFISALNASGLYFGNIELVAVDGTNRTETVDVPITVEVIPYSPPVQTNDTEGPVITGISQSPLPAVKLQSLMIFVNASDESTGNNTISGCKIDADNSDNWQDMSPEDGAYDQTIELSKYNYTSGFDLGPHTIRANCTDVLNNTGPVAYYYFEVNEADMLGPIVIQMNHTEWPTTLTNISVGGIATDAYTGNSNVQNCSVKVNSGSWNPAIPDDGDWDSPTENFSYNVGPLPVGYHNVYYQCIDSLGNLGGVYNDSFGIVDVDLMLVLDRSGSMAENITNVQSSSIVSAASTGWSWVKNITVNQKNGDAANLSVEIRASTSGCMVSYNATINGVEVATGNRTSTSYGVLKTTINITNYTEPYSIALWLKRNASGCTAYNRLLSLQQAPTKMIAAQGAASSFIDIAGNNIQAGLASYSFSSTLDSVLALMTPSNQTTLKNAINALTPGGNTCIECGLTTAANELTSVRARPNATKIIVLLTDGISNVGNSVTGAVYCRDRNITVYTIGFGYDVNDVELTNIALLTYGEYYFAPNVETLTAIFQNIGK